MKFCERTDGCLLEDSHEGFCLTSARDADQPTLDRDTIQACLKAIDKHIADGPLEGGGWEPNAQRNGMVLAYNAVYQLLRAELTPPTH